MKSQSLSCTSPSSDLRRALLKECIYFLKGLIWALKETPQTTRAFLLQTHRFRTTSEDNFISVGAPEASEISMGLEMKRLSKWNRWLSIFVVRFRVRSGGTNATPQGTLIAFRYIF